MVEYSDSDVLKNTSVFMDITEDGEILCRRRIRQPAEANP